MEQQAYSIGVKGKKWGDAEKAQWFNAQSIKRSYQDEVVSKILALKDRFDVEQYGALSYDAKRYPLFAVKTHNWDANKATILVTGGVHGYETSGVQGAIRFIETQAANYSDKFNILVTPCISPWGYETINRWNPKAIDPNRSFYADSSAEESAALIKLLAELGVEMFAHIDLHETTDTDNSEFRPALAARDAVEHTNWNIPDGFYLVGDTINPQDEFQTAMIKSVEQVTHIAPADDSGKLIGVDLAQFGVINYATKALGLCAGVTDAKYVTTTEVYPDSPLSDDENCIVAQVAAITGGLDYLLTL
ncbi:zinc carboxypeptidase-related protein [Shewanella halifaxensis HAW-EB4]|uniref:Zinc carboxypeptidase-related protein n=1 Tax=Shewanella halifaxensis (strain HAW-EB4) TaxID=458817 RepID=B0TP28_SHEHH|nr:M14 family metallocarboxypeptidase [Shewanella halifaxensis]ABZ76185.1 zinc carboxypeptidase-related protein [Shewanella halifaxensis HAW-EB4]